MAKILDAALTLFADQGYAATRIEDVATRAGLSKGGLYAHVRSKRDLFDALVRGVMVPRLSAIWAAEEVPLPPFERLARMLDIAYGALQDPRARSVLRLVITEGPRVPEVAEIYHSEVVGPAMATVGAILAEGEACGAFRPSPMRTTPQLAIAPMITTLLWLILFDRLAPLDPAAMKDGHLAMLKAMLEPADDRADPSQEAEHPAPG